LIPHPDVISIRVARAWWRAAGRARRRCSTSRPGAAVPAGWRTALA